MLLCQQMSHKRAKKLVSISTISTSVTEDSEKAIIDTKELGQVTCIQYFITFPDGVTQDGLTLNLVSAFLDLGSKVNAIHPIFIDRLGLVVQNTNVGAQKIDGTTLESYGMIVIAFSMTDKADKVRFFEETFLVVNISLDMVFGIHFLTLSDADIDFLKRKLWWRFYIIKEAFLTTKQVELVGKKEFASAVHDLGHESFVVHIAFLESLSQESDIHPSCKTQIAALVANEAFTLIPTEYSDFADVFSPKLTSKLPKHPRINNHTIKLVNNWQPSYGPIYNLESVELETWKLTLRLTE